MLPRATAPALRFSPSRGSLRGPAREPYPRRDPRRFGLAPMWLDDVAPALEIEPSDNLRLFAHSFAGFFLFFLLLIA